MIPECIQSHVDARAQFNSNLFRKSIIVYRHTGCGTCQNSRYNIVKYKYYTLHITKGTFYVSRYDINTYYVSRCNIVTPLNPKLNPICYLLALLGTHHFLHVSRIRVKLLTLRRLMSYIYIYIYIYGAPILDVSRSHTTTHHSR